MPLPSWLPNNEELALKKEADELNDIADGIHAYYIWPLVALGIPGNLLTIITLVTMGKITPGSFFIAMLAISDLAALVCKFVHIQLDIHDVTKGPVGCKMDILTNYFVRVANWTLALIAFERFISVCFPLQKAFLFTKRRSYMAAGVLLVAFLVILTPVYGAIYSSSDDGKVCGVKPKYSFFWNRIWHWIDASLFLFIPFILCSFFTICIICGLRKSRLDRRRLLMKEENGSSSKGTNSNMRMLKETQRMERMLTIMLILATVLFLILALPACIFFLAHKREFDDDLEKAQWYLFQQVQYMIVDSSHAINFFLYFLSARRFRTHLISLVTCKKAVKRQCSDPSKETDSSVLSATTTKM